jgi:hypothetical protein
MKNMPSLSQFKRTQFHVVHLEGFPAILPLQSMVKTGV